MNENERETPMVNALCEKMSLTHQTHYRDLKAMCELAESLERMCAELAEALGAELKAHNKEYPIKCRCSDCITLAKYTVMKGVKR